MKVYLLESNWGDGCELEGAFSSEEKAHDAAKILDLHRWNITEIVIDDLEDKGHWELIARGKKSEF